MIDETVSKIAITAAAKAIQLGVQDVMCVSTNGGVACPSVAVFVCAGRENEIRAQRPKEKSKIKYHQDDEDVAKIFWRRLVWYGCWGGDGSGLLLRPDYLTGEPGKIVIDFSFLPRDVLELMARTFGDAIGIAMRDVCALEEHP